MSAVSGVTGSVGGLGGGAGITNGLGGSVGPASGSIGTQTDVGVPSVSPPNVSTEGVTAPSTPQAGVGASAGTNVNAPAVGISNSTGAQTSAPGNASIGGTVPVASLPDPLTNLQHVTVQSRDGAVIGTISGVKLGPDGKPSTINVSLTDAVGGASKISLIPDQLTFDQSNKLVVSSLSQAEIDSLAAAQKQTR
jgi:hypothetical protein